MGHPPLGPLPLPSASAGLKVCCSKERALPAAISRVCKDNALRFEAGLDGCTPSRRLMDTHIYSNGAVDCVWPPAKSRRPVFQTCKHSSTLMHLTEAWKVNVQ